MSKRWIRLSCRRGGGTGVDCASRRSGSAGWCDEGDSTRTPWRSRRSLTGARCGPARAAAKGRASTATAAPLRLQPCAEGQPRFRYPILLRHGAARRDTRRVERLVAFHAQATGHIRRRRLSTRNPGRAACLRPRTGARFAPRDRSRFSGRRRSTASPVPAAGPLPFPIEVVAGRHVARRHHDRCAEAEVVAVAAVRRCRRHEGDRGGGCDGDTERNFPGR